MTRQYKGMQEDLLARLSALNKQIDEQNDALDLSRLQLEEVRTEKAQARAALLRPRP